MAFEINLGKGITMSSLYNHIVVTSENAVQKQLLYVDQKDGWWRGVLLTSKDIKAFSRMVREKGIVRISPEAIHNGELAHFNFFLLNAQTQRGYFQYYHGSSSLHGFCDVLKKKYNDLKDILLTDACRKFDADISNIPTHITRQFSGNLRYEIVLRKKSFKELIEGLNYIKNITFQFKEYIPAQPLFRPLAEKAKSIRHRLTFTTHHDNSLLSDIVALGNANVIKDLRGIGVAEGNIEKPFRLLNEPETLERFDFNDVVLATEFDSRDIPQSLDDAPMMKHLLNIAEQDGWAAA